MHYNTLIFDAFDTVVHIDWSKLPTHRVNGRVIQTTAPVVHAKYTELFRQTDFDVFYAAFSQSHREVTARRRLDLREIPCQERFRIMLDLLGHSDGDVTDDAIETLTRAHMGRLQEAFEVRPETLEVLEWVKTRYRTAMISNFNYAPTLYAALNRFGIHSAFEAIMDSAEVGWCKPHPVIFRDTFMRMGIRPSEALFIGDQLYLDVYGSLNSGMDVVWIETKEQSDWTPPEFHAADCKPTHIVRSISELIPLLENKR